MDLLVDTARDQGLEAAMRLWILYDDTPYVNVDQLRFELGPDWVAASLVESWQEWASLHGFLTAAGGWTEGGDLSAGLSVRFEELLAANTSLNALKIDGSLAAEMTLGVAYDGDVVVDINRLGVSLGGDTLNASVVESGAEWAAFNGTYAAAGGWELGGESPATSSIGWAVARSCFSMFLEAAIAGRPNVVWNTINSIVKLGSSVRMVAVGGSVGLIASELK